LRLCRIDDHGFASRLTDFSESSYDKCDHKPDKIMRGDDGQRIERESAEGRNYERPSPNSIRCLGRWNIDDKRRGEQNCEQRSESCGAYVKHVCDVDDYEHIRHAFASANKDVRDQQPFQVPVK